MLYYSQAVDEVGSPSGEVMPLTLYEKLSLVTAALTLIVSILTLLK